jgi:hypothetical protein
MSPPNDIDIPKFFTFMGWLPTKANALAATPGRLRGRLKGRVVQRCRLTAASDVGAVPRTLRHRQQHRKALRLVVRVVHSFRRNGPRFTCINLSAVQRIGRAFTASPGLCKRGRKSQTAPAYSGAARHMRPQPPNATDPNATDYAARRRFRSRWRSAASRIAAIVVLSTKPTSNL